MIRVFIIGVLAFGALVLVTRNLPDSAFRPAPSRDEAAQPQRVEALRGVWEGTLEMRRMNGTPAGSLAIRQTRTVDPEGVARIRIEERAGSGAVTTTDVDIVRRSDAGDAAVFERTERREGAQGRLWRGRMEGKALVWSWEDPAGGEKQSFREELMHGENGPILAVDGAGVRAGEPLLFAGRYRQVERDAR